MKRFVLSILAAGVAAAMAAQTSAPPASSPAAPSGSAARPSPSVFLLHLPMFWMGHKTGFVLAGMPLVDPFFPCRSLRAITSSALPYGDLTPLSRPPRNGY